MHDVICGLMTYLPRSYDVDNTHVFENVPDFGLFQNVPYLFPANVNVPCAQNNIVPRYIMLITKCTFFKIESICHWVCLDTQKRLDDFLTARLF